jgi:hypothetical protein
MEQIEMKYKDMHIGKTYAFNGKEYEISCITSYGPGLLYLCERFTFSPKHDQTLPEISAMRWADGEIDRFKVVSQPLFTRPDTNEFHSYRTEKQRYHDMLSGFGSKKEFYENMRHAN